VSSPAGTKAASVAPSPEWEAVDTCDLCGSQRRRAGERYQVGEVECILYDCGNCGLAYVSPRPTPESIGRFYDTGYEAMHGIYLEPPVSRVVTPMLRRLLRVRYGPSPAGRRLVRLVVPWERKWRRILREQHLQAIAGLGAVLDVGCGRGYWLATMRRWGFECVGCEPDRAVAEAARAQGLNVHVGDLIQAAFPDGRFDVVRFSHVLEHVHSPLAVLTEVARILRPGGVVVVTVPNHVGLVANAFRETEDVPRHLFSFCPDTLARAMGAVGLQVVEARTETPTPRDLYSQFPPAFRRALVGRSDAEDALSQVNDLLDGQARRSNGEFRRLVGLIDVLGLGCQVVVVARKGEAPSVDPQDVACASS